MVEIGGVKKNPNYALKGIGITSLMRACESGNIAIVGLLIGTNADVRLSHVPSKTALNWAGRRTKDHKEQFVQVLEDRLVNNR